MGLQKSCRRRREAVECQCNYCWRVQARDTACSAGMTQTSISSTAATKQNVIFSSSYSVFSNFSFIFPFHLRACAGHTAVSVLSHDRKRETEAEESLMSSMRGVGWDIFHDLGSVVQTVAWSTYVATLSIKDIAFYGHDKKARSSKSMSASLNEASWIKLLTLPQPCQLFSKTGISLNGTWMPSVLTERRELWKFY